MDEFPDLDEEYDLIESTPHIIPTKTSEKDISTGDKPHKNVENSNSDSLQICNGSTQSQDDSNATFAEPVKKRTYEEIMKDYDDFFLNGALTEAPMVKEKIIRWSDKEAVIDLILNERKKRKMTKYSDKSLDRFSNEEIDQSAIQKLQNSVSTTVPRWNFVVLTTLSDFKRVYVRVRDKKKKPFVLDTKPVSGLLSTPFSEMIMKAQENLEKKVERENTPTILPVNSKKTDNQLWVDKYRPRGYLELLTDESVNVALLRWIKLWDKVVFNKEIKKKKKSTKTGFTFQSKFNRELEDEGVDSRGFPNQKIALLSGPPGLGKTTLAHLIAKHAGYNVVEINASDDRGPDAFREALLAATEMRSVMGANPKPNCLILDEVDGASAASIDLLIKYVQGKLLPKRRKKVETAKKNDGCKRPVICICNEGYTPSLRPLRTMAFIIPVPKINPSHLVDRLEYIARREKLRVDRGSLHELVERSGCDVRSCLCALQYMGQTGSVDNLNVGLKDAKRGLFDCWRDILQIPMSMGGLLPARKRVEIALTAAHSCETERLALGIFHNYPQTCVSQMDVISGTLNWYLFHDQITRTVMSEQEWRLMPYANYAVVAWHFGFASTQFIKLTYPYAHNEAFQKLNKNISMLTVTKQTYNRDINTLVMDVVPFLPALLTPKLRAISGHLYSANERADLARLINVMLELGLSLVQTKTDERNVDYVFDPNLLEIAIFPEFRAHRGLPFAVKQIVAQELQTERVRRSATASASRSKGTSGEETLKEVAKPASVSNDDSSVPNHLRQLTPIAVQPQKAKYRDFFENFVLKKKEAEEKKSPGSSPKGDKPAKRFRHVLTKYGVWYKYKEGFSNSVRRNVKMSKLL